MYPDPQWGAVVTHINLDGQGEAVKQFFLSLPTDPEGTVVELNGQALARLLPIAAAENGSSDEEWTDAKNERRCELIDRKYASGLTLQEEVELAALQVAMDRQVDRVAPLPLEATRKLHQQVLQKAIQAQAGRDG
jgi:hypothetical protein